MTALLYLLTFTLALALWVMARGLQRIPYLFQLTPQHRDDLPSYAIVVAARNEAESLRQTVEALCRQSLPAKNVIIVNDRSEDHSRSILEDLSQTYTQLRCIHVETLPEGWLGKNHALWLGVNHTQADYVLLSDGDVVLEPTTMARAIEWISQDPRVAHAVVIPEVPSSSKVKSVMMSYLSLGFLLFLRAWQVPNPHRRAFMGIGAFNLVKREAYLASGGHRALAMRPDEDLALGRLMKVSGYRTLVAFGLHHVQVEWYRGLGEMVRGFEKNIYAGFNYQLALVVAVVCAIVLFHILPFLFMLSFFGFSEALRGASAALSTLWLIGAGISNRYLGYPWWTILGFPVAAGVFVFIIVRSVTKNLWDGGISWRGTFYSFDALRQSSGPPAA